MEDFWSDHRFAIKELKQPERCCIDAKELPQYSLAEQDENIVGQYGIHP